MNLVQQNNNLKGVFLIALGFFFFSCSDTLAKLLTVHFHPLQVVWMRMIGLVIGVFFLFYRHGIKLFSTPKPKLQLLRGAVAAGSGTLFIYAINYVPLADAIAVTFVAPFLVTILGATVLKEPVGLRRWLAVLVGFVGMLVVIRPGMGVFHPAIFLVILAAGFFAIRQLLSRWLSGVDSVSTTVAYTSVVAFAITSIALPFVWITPSGLPIVLMIVGLALSAAVGEVFIIRALDVAQSVVLAPMHYTLIIWGTLYGFWFFGELPDSWTFVGCGIIVASGLYTTYREFVRAA